MQRFCVCVELRFLVSLSSRPNTSFRLLFPFLSLEELLEHSRTQQNRSATLPPPPGLPYNRRGSGGCPSATGILRQFSHTPFGRHDACDPPHRKERCSSLRGVCTTAVVADAAFSARAPRQQHGRDQCLPSDRHDVHCDASGFHWQDPQSYAMGVGGTGHLPLLCLLWCRRISRSHGI